MDTTTRPDHSVPKGHRVTTLELFFDLVFVYAITQVTALISEDPSPRGLTQGVLLILVLWWCWCCYAWLATTVRADAGRNRVIMLAAMSALFLIALTIPESFADLPGGGLDGPLLFAGCYLVVRVLHVAAFVLAGRGDRDLLTVVGRTAVPMLAGSSLLAVAAFTDGAWQLGLWAAALLIDYVGVFVVSGGNWWLESPVHFCERHGLIVIIALGESIVAIGIGITGQAVSWLVVATALGGLLIACCLWWMYFIGAAERAQEALARAQGRDRSALARDAYTFLHLPMVAGIVLMALGLKKALTYVSDVDNHPVGEALHGVPLWTLTSGVALFVLAQVAFRFRILRTWNPARVVLAVAVLAATPLFELLPAAGAVGVVAACCAALVAYEALRHRLLDAVLEEPVPEYQD